MGGGKGSSAPPPDPRLVEAQLKSMGMQDQGIQQMMAQSKQLAPLQMQQMQQGIEDQNTARTRNTDSYNYSMGKRNQLDSVVNPLVSEANSFNETGRRADLMHQAQSDAEQNYSNISQQQNQAYARMGITPDSGKAEALNNQTALAKAAALTSAGQQVTQAAHQEGIGLRSNVANMLSGYPGMGMQATGAGSQFGTMGLNMANTGLSGLNSGAQAYGGMAGQMGNNATNMWGAQAQYKSTQDKIAADSNPTNAILGAATGAGMAWATGGMSAAGAKTAGGPSDIRLKKDITRIGTLASGLPVYTFRYKSGGPMTMGVMAHEVAVLVPDAYLPGGFDGVHHAVDYSKIS